MAFTFPIAGPGASAIHPVYAAAAVALGRPTPSAEVDPTTWLQQTFSVAAAVTLILAARAHYDAGHIMQAEELLEDACRAERTAAKSSGFHTKTTLG